MYNPGQEISSLNFGAIIGGALNAVVDAQAQSSYTSVNFIKSTGFAPGKEDANGKVIGVGDPITVSFKYTKEVSPYIPGKSVVYGVNIADGGRGYSDAFITGIKLGAGGAELLVPGDYSIVYGDNGEIKTISFLKNPISKAGDPVEIVVDESLIPSGVAPPVAAKDMKLTQKTADGRPPVFQNMELSVPILTMLPIPFIRIEYADIDFNVKINSVSNTETKDSTTSNVNSNSSVGYGGFGVTASTTLNASVSNQKSSSASENVKKDFSLNIKVHAVQDDMPAGISRILDILEANIISRPSAAVPPAPSPAPAA